MSYFANAGDVYRTLGRMLEVLAGDEDLGIERADTVVRNEYSDPDAVITVRLRPGEEVLVDFGPSALEPEIVIAMKADVARRFWLGEVNVPLALAHGEMVASGPTAKVLRLVPLLQAGFPRSRELLTEQARADLAPV
jgi:hypothetical protein